MAEYDSILKEKKKYEEPVKETGPKPFPWFKIDVILIILVLIISYIIYYIKILTPDQIFLTDLQKLTEKYQGIFEPLNLSQLDNNYNLEGLITLDDKEYTYSLVQNENIQKFSLSLNSDTLSYYNIENLQYLKLSSFQDNYIKLNTNNTFNIFHNLKDYLTNKIPKDKFIKKFYLNGTTPIVESNLVINNDDLKQALNLDTLEDSYEVLFTFKNHSITNEIISMKVTINNLTTSARKVILYENGSLTIKDDEKTLKFQLEENADDFILKIYTDDTLFSVLTGTKQENSYQYTYQVIDKIYTITLKVSEESNTNRYELESKIEEDDIITNQKLTITYQYQNDIILESTDIAGAKNYGALTEEELTNYNSSLEEIIGDLRKFIDEYQ